MPDTPVFELQAHSLHSDGELCPDDLVAAAAAAGVELLALTDHDSVAGIPEAREAAQAHGIALITGVEVSVLDEAGQDLHLLGYGFDPEAGELERRLRRSREDREHRATRTVARLRELGFEVEEASLEKRQASGRSVGRPHLAEAVVGHPGNRARLERESISDPTTFLVRYLIEGTPAFVPRSAPSVAEAITVIHEAGGYAVWAHPFFDIASDASVLAALERFRSLGLDGVEAFYPTHTREQTELLLSAGAEHALITTGSSDFHGTGHRTFNRFRAFSLYDLEPDLTALLARADPPL